MRRYAAYVGEPSKRGGYRSQKLTGGDHSALGDALATLRLIEEMAAGRGGE
jgi:DNA polymerase-3 subunit epsilon